VVQQYFIGVFVNNFLPSTVGGDAAKVFYLGRSHGYRAITASIVLDRLLGLGLLATLATAALWAAGGPHPQYVAARLVLTGITAVFAAVIALAIVGTGGLPRRAQRFGARAVAAATHLQEFRVDLAAAVRQPRVWVKATATIVIYFVLLTLVYEGFLALQTGIAAPGFLPLLTAITSVAVLSNVPISINGLGVREQLHVLMLQPLGVPKDVALAISLLMFGHLLVASLLGGIVWWRASRRLQRNASSNSTTSL
jgi:glycosyltransferase 2 family protein